jgi:pimeloyl-ACP methyl ester carboxylesterase
MSSLVDPIDPGFVREFQQSTLAQPIPASMLEDVVSESLKVQARVWDKAWSGMLETDITSELSRIDAPTLIVGGDRDSLALRPEQELLLRSIPDARIEVFVGAGHAAHWEEPKRFATLLGNS